MANEEYKFPDEVEAKAEAAPEPEFNIEIEDDTPAEDRGRHSRAP